MYIKKTWLAPSLQVPTVALVALMRWPRARTGRSRLEHRQGWTSVPGAKTQTRMFEIRTPP